MHYVENEHCVLLNYKVLDKDTGLVVDSNDDKDNPFMFLLGKNQVITGLEKALIGKEVGSTFDVEISPEDGYGARDSQLLQEVSKDQFSGINLRKGMTLFGQNDHGQTVQVVVDEIGENSVIIDYNHPLAGKTLLFNVTILDSRHPTEDDILSLMPSSCGCSGHDHGSGGCGCGSGGCGCSH